MNFQAIKQNRLMLHFDQFKQIMLNYAIRKISLVLAPNKPFIKIRYYHRHHYHHDLGIHFLEPIK